MTPNSSGVPRPPSPTKPTACESSTSTSALVLVGQVADLVERGERAVHREHAVGDDAPGGGRPPAASSWASRSAMSALR